MSERRSYKRIPANINTRFFMDNIFYVGKVKDISENSMFIKTNVLVPSGALFVVLISANQKLLQLLARVRRTTGKKSSLQGMGVEIINPPREYKDFVEGLSYYLYR